MGGQMKGDEIRVSEGRMHPGGEEKQIFLIIKKKKTVPWVLSKGALTLEATVHRPMHHPLDAHYDSDVD
jgi:hypothetical protein